MVRVVVVGVAEAVPATAGRRRHCQSVKKGVCALESTGDGELLVGPGGSTPTKSARRVAVVALLPPPRTPAQVRQGGAFPSLKREESKEKGHVKMK